MIIKKRPFLIIISTSADMAEVYKINSYNMLIKRIKKAGP